MCLEGWKNTLRDKESVEKEVENAAPIEVKVEVRAFKEILKQKYKAAKLMLEENSGVMIIYCAYTRSHVILKAPKGVMGFIVPVTTSTDSQFRNGQIDHGISLTIGRSIASPAAVGLSLGVCSFQKNNIKDGFRQITVDY